MSKKQRKKKALENSHLKEDFSIDKMQYTLEELVSGITVQIMHDAIETGPAQGKEVW